MFTEPRRQLLLSPAAAICLALTSLFITGCDRLTATDATGVVLHADPNPVPAGKPQGTTTLTWDTGSKNTAGDVYVVEGGKEKLFGSGAKGSQEAPWIKPGSTEFRLYKHSDHTLLAQLTVTMPRSPEAVTSASVTPASSVTP